MIGYAISGSFCSFEKSYAALAELVGRGEDVLPIMSQTAYTTDTRFQASDEFASRVEKLCNRKIIHTIAEAEPLGPIRPLEALIISPCTGNTLAKLANGITDTSVTMAAKAHLRRDRPLLVALSTNDALSQNLGNLARLLTRRSVYFVPMIQDSPTGKPHSLVADTSLISAALDAMRRGEQLRPLFKEAVK